MLNTPRYHVSILLLVTAMLLGGCATSTPSRFYTLNAVTDNSQLDKVMLSERQLVIGVGPVKLARYLDRPQIITRLDDNRFEIAEFDRWGGSLQDDITRTLTEDIRRLLPEGQVLSYPWRGKVHPDFRIPIEIFRFEGIAGKRVVLVAHWQVFDGDDGTRLASMRSEFNEPIEGDSYGAMVAAHSRTLARLASEIALSLQHLPADQSTGGEAE